MSGRALLLACALVVALAPRAHADDPRVEGLLRAYSEDGLAIEATSSAILEDSGWSCPVSDEERADFERRLRMTKAQELWARRQHAPWGIPQAEDPKLDKTILIHREYILGYDDDLKVPVWAQYRLTHDDIVGRERERCFREDARLPFDSRSTLDDYDEPIFHRGHLVPRADMNRTRATMMNTFLMSNMAPQYKHFNERVWRYLEAMVRIWASRYHEIWVVTGAIFDHDGDGYRDPPGEVPRMQPTDRIGIPSHFYKVVVTKSSTGFIEALSIVLPHTEEPDLVLSHLPSSEKPEAKKAYFDSHIVNVDTLEKLTGLDFFPEMSVRRQRPVEREKAEEIWPLAD